MALFSICHVAPSSLRSWKPWALAPLLIILTGSISGALAASPIVEALKDSSPLLNTRLRYEYVDQDGIARTADAVTLRVRAGLETGEVGATRGLIEFDWVESLNSDFNSTINGKTAYPVVADPEVVELNRLQVTNRGLPNTAITLGRQRIILDDARFVGNVGWRQNEQTFDAVRVDNTSLPGVTASIAYIWQVNRIFGDDSPMGRFDGDNVIGNVSYASPVGTLTGFAYLVELVEAPALSSQTYGARFSGSRSMGRARVDYMVSAATQKDYQNSPLDYSERYLAGHLGVSFDGFTVAANWESLGGDGTAAFTMPLATLHKFQGWADKFLGTPPDGIDDIYFQAGYKRPDVGPFGSVTAVAFYHDFDAQRGGADYGEELDLLLTATWRDLSFTLKYADYNAKAFATDTQKFSIQIDFAL